MIILTQGELTPQEDTTPKVHIHSVEVQGVTGSLGPNRYILPVNTSWTLTASSKDLLSGIPGLPDGSFIVILEKIISGNTVVDDSRALAHVSDGIISMTGKFEVSGNYNLDPQRLSKGLQDIGLNLNLLFDKLEFDAYNV